MSSTAEPLLSSSRRLPKLLPVVGLLCALVVVTVLGINLYPRWQEYNLSRQDLPSLLRQQAQHQNDALYLGHLGRRLNAEQRFAEALPLLQQAVGLSPHETTLRDEWTKAQMGTGRLAEAYGQLKEFLAANPNAAGPPFLLGKFYMSQEALSPAREMLEKAVQRDPRNDEAWFLLALCRIKAANNGAAIEALEKVIALRPNHAQAHLQLGVLYASQKPDVAKAAFQKSLAADPNDAEAHREYGRFLLTTSDLTGAEKEIRLALEKNRSDAVTYTLLGRCLLDQHRAKEAIAPLTDAASLTPSDPAPAEILRRAYRQLADAANVAFWDKRFLVLRENQEARRKWEQETIARPQDRHAHEMLATYLCKAGEVNACARHFALSLRMSPEKPRVLLATARALNEAGFAKEALPLARSARAKTQMNPEAFEVLGDTLVNLGRTHEAAVNYMQIRDWHKERMPEYQRKIAEANARVNASIATTDVTLRQALLAPDLDTRERYVKESLKADPENTRALRELLRIQFGSGRLEEATETAKRLMDTAPEDGLGHTLFCLIYLQKSPDKQLTEGEVTAINQHLVFAEADSSVEGTAHYVRGLLALRQSNPKLAVQYLEKALQVDPNSPAVYARLADARRALGDTTGAARAEAHFNQLKTP